MKAIICKCGREIPIDALTPIKKDDGKVEFEIDCWRCKKRHWFHILYKEVKKEADSTADEILGGEENIRKIFRDAGY